MTLGHSNRNVQPHTMVDVYKYSFFPLIIKIWNHLSEEVIHSSHLHQFKWTLCIHYLANYDFSVMLVLCTCIANDT